MTVAVGFPTLGRAGAGPSRGAVFTRAGCSLPPDPWQRPGLAPDCEGFQPAALAGGQLVPHQPLPLRRGDHGPVRCLRHRGHRREPGGGHQTAVRAAQHALPLLPCSSLSSSQVSRCYFYTSVLCVPPVLLIMRVLCSVWKPPVAPPVMPHDVGQPEGILPHFATWLH